MSCKHPDLKRIIVYTSVLMVAAFVCPSTQAVLIRDGDGSGNTTSPPGLNYFENIGRRGDGTGIYLGNLWVLTAWHLTIHPDTKVHTPPANLWLGNTKYLRDTTVTPVRVKNPDESNTDILLFKLLPDPFLATLPYVPIATGTPSIGDEMLMVGRGRDRESNQVEWNSNTTPWTEVASGGNRIGYKWAIGKSIRWGTNKVNNTHVTSPGALIFDNGNGNVYAFSTAFNRNSNLPDSEAQVLPGDSGGPAFKMIGGEWVMNGMIDARDFFDGQPNLTSVFGNESFIADLSIYHDQIFDVVGSDLRSLGDFDGDGDIGGNDFLIWQQGFFTASGAIPSDGDADGDGDVDGQDFLIWQGNFHSPGTAANLAVAPEPMTLVVLLLTSGVVFTRHSRRNNRS